MASTAIPKVVRAVVGDLVKVAEKTPNLKSVSKIHIAMCPWNKNSASTKELWRRVSGEDVRDSNRKCVITTDMRHDDSEPAVKIEFNDGEKLLLKGANLKWDELMYHLNAFCHDKEQAMLDVPQKLF